MELTTEDQGVSVFEDDQRMLVVAVTDEGVIIDAYRQGDDETEPVGTIAKTAEEWWEYLQNEQG